MKKILFWGVLILAIVVTSCKEDDKTGVDANDLQDASNLKMTVKKASSIFEPIKVSFNKNIGAEIENSDDEIVRINIDSVVFAHKTALGSKTTVDGNWEMTSDSIGTFTPSEILKLSEPYFLTVYFSWEQKHEGTWTAVKDNDREYYRSLWAEISPSVIDGKDILFSTERGGTNNTSLVPYDDKMFVNFSAPVLFDIDQAPGSTQIALLFNWITVTGNNKDDYAIWNLETDSNTAAFSYTSEIPETDDLHTHLLPNTYYSIKLDMSYVYNNNGKWDYVLNSDGDTTVWNYIKEFSTQELFVPGEIIYAMSPKNKGVVMIDSIPQLILNETNETVISYNGIEFKPVMDYFKITKGSQEVLSDFVWAEKGDIELATGDSMLATITPDSLYLLPGAEYVVSASAHWEYKIDTAWHNILELDTVMREVVSSKITAELPSIPSIIASYSIEAEDVNMDAAISVKLSTEKEKAIEIDGFSVKPVLDVLKLKSGSILEIDTFIWDDANRTATILRDSFLIPSIDYEILTQAHWEYQDKDGIFKQLSDDGLITFENKSFKFQTMSVPNRIVESILPKGSNRDLNSIPSILFNYTDGQEVEKDGIRFKVIFDKDSLKFYQGSDHLVDSLQVPFTTTWEGTGAILNHSIVLQPDQKYSVRMLSHWQYFENDEWRNILDNGEIRYEGETAKGFRTTEAPQDLFGDITPNAENVALDSTITINLNYDSNVPFEFGGAEFMLLIDEIRLMKGNDTIEVSTVWSDSKTGVLTPTEYFELDASYKLIIQTHIEYKDETGAWLDAGGEVEELNTSVVFTTATNPGAIVGSITPSGSDIKLDTTIILNLLFAENGETDHAGILFTSVLDSFIVTNGAGKVDGSLVFDADKKQGTFSSTPFTAGETYESKAYTHWEYKNKSGAAVILDQLTTTQSFSTISE